MPKLVFCYEGQGDQQAITTLLFKLFHEREVWDWHVDGLKVQSLGKLQKRLGDFLTYAAKKQGDAILILLDSDRECPIELAQSLVHQIRALDAFPTLPPIAIVFAHPEYEAWLLASLPTLVGHHGLAADLVYEGEVENAGKKWFKTHMPQTNKYEEPIHQAAFTTLLNPELARERSRSFRRLESALTMLLAAAATNARGLVSPALP